MSEHEDPLTMAMLNVTEAAIENRVALERLVAASTGFARTVAAVAEIERREGAELVTPELVREELGRLPDPFVVSLDAIEDFARRAEAHGAPGVAAAARTAATALSPS